MFLFHQHPIISIFSPAVTSFPGGLNPLIRNYDGNKNIQPSFEMLGLLSLNASLPEQKNNHHLFSFNVSNCYQI